MVFLGLLGGGLVGSGRDPDQTNRGWYTHGPVAKIGHPGQNTGSFGQSFGRKRTTTTTTTATTTTTTAHTGFW